MAKRRPHPLKLSHAVHEKLSRVARRHHLTPDQAAKRLIEWVSKQPELIQAAVLGRFSRPIDAELAKHVIRSILRVLKE